MEHEWQSIHNTDVSVCTVDGRKYLIGTQVANLLDRETFNMYRSMKGRNIVLHRAEADQVDFMVRSGAVKAGTHSVTLVPLEEGLAFISDALARGTKVRHVEQRKRVPKRSRRQEKDSSDDSYDSGGDYSPSNDNRQQLQQQQQQRGSIRPFKRRRHKNELEADGSSSPLTSPSAEEHDDDDEQEQRQRLVYMDASELISSLTTGRAYSAPTSPLPSTTSSIHHHLKPSLLDQQQQQQHEEEEEDDGEEEENDEKEEEEEEEEDDAEEQPSNTSCVTSAPTPRPVRSRRKPPPWEVYRSIRKSECIPFHGGFLVQRHTSNLPSQHHSSDFAADVIAFHKLHRLSPITVYDFAPSTPA